MHQHAGNLDHRDAIDDCERRLALAAVILCQPVGQDSGAGVRGGSSHVLGCDFKPRQPHGPPGDARPQPGEERHGLGRLDQQGRVERSLGNLGM